MTTTQTDKETPTPRPHLVLLSTGGTIVSSGDNAAQTTGYSLRGLTVQALLDGVPGLGQLARLTVEPVANIDSSSMTSSVWLALAEAVEAAAARDDVDGIVITHGTDTLEETAYFLALTLTTAKPVVMTGAMRPSTAISADGPMNLYNAVRVAADKTSAGRGVLVMLNDVVLGARDATKTHPTNVATFRSPPSGALGLIAGARLIWLARAEREHNPHALLPVARVRHYVETHGAFARVDIVMTHVDADDVMVKAALNAGAAGIVHAGSGNGSIHSGTEAALFEARKRGVMVVRASRTAAGATVEGAAEWQTAGMIPAQTLNAQKARVLLQLALMGATELGLTTDSERLGYCAEAFEVF